MDIWEERKVFGSRGQNLKDEMLGKHPPPSISNGKSSNPIKIVKRDSHSLRIVSICYIYLVSFSDSLFFSLLQFSRRELYVYGLPWIISNLVYHVFRNWLLEVCQKRY